jgi:hypothetical protein
MRSKWKGFRILRGEFAREAKLWDVYSPDLASAARPQPNVGFEDGNILRQESSPLPRGERGVFGQALSDSTLRWNRRLCFGRLHGGGLADRVG